MAKRTLGKYDIIERLGRGGMAEVYKGYQSSLDRFVAIKLLHPFLADDPEFKDRFEREARNVARLRHPNIVQVYDFEYDNDSESYFMVMELIDGQTLKDYLTNVNAESLLPIAESLRILRGATEALAYAHARGMIHRDVKPANLMLDSDGRVVLTDFGIAKIVTGHQFTASGGMVGTPAYMAPEQGLGDAGDERSDLYSLGVILFQLATGKLPYDADTPLAVILKHLNEPTPQPTSVNPNIPPEIEAIILKAMAKDPEERYQKADEMLADMGSVHGIEMSDSLPPANLAKADGVPDTTSGRRYNTGIRRTLSGAENAAVAAAGGAAGRVPPRKGQGFGAIGAAIIIGVLIGILGLITMTTGRIPLLGIAIRSTETSTPTNTPEPTSTPVDSPTPTATATLTSTATPSPTLTLTPTLTPSQTQTPTPNITQTIEVATATAGKQTLDAFFLTQKAQTTPTVDFTGTAANCVREFRQIVKQEAQKDPIKADRDFTREIVLRNISNCDWLPGMTLNYKSGERFALPAKITMKNTDPVKPGEDATFVFEGHTPKKGGLYNIIWEVRLVGEVLFTEPLTVSFFVFE